MKAFSESNRKTIREAGLILLLTEKLAVSGLEAARDNRDEHRQTDILTSGLTSLPPSRR